MATACVLSGIVYHRALTMRCQRPLRKRTSCPGSRISRLVVPTFILLPLIGALPLAANVVINEVLASNVNSAFDDEGESSDWLELLNIGDAPLELAAYALSDDPAQPRKWVFPEGTLR